MYILLFIRFALHFSSDVPMRKKEYYKIETVRILLYPIFLFLVAWFFVGQGWVKPEETGIVWSIILINVIASLLSIGVYYFIAEK